MTLYDTKSLLKTYPVNGIKKDGTQNLFHLSEKKDSIHLSLSHIYLYNFRRFTEAYVVRIEIKHVPFAVIKRINLRRGEAFEIKVGYNLSKQQFNDVFKQCGDSHKLFTTNK